MEGGVWGGEIRGKKSGEEIGGKGESERRKKGEEKERVGEMRRNSSHNA